MEKSVKFCIIFFNSVHFDCVFFIICHLIYFLLTCPNDILRKIPNLKLSWNFSETILSWERYLWQWYDQSKKKRNWYGTCIFICVIYLKRCWIIWISHLHLSPLNYIVWPLKSLCIFYVCGFGCWNSTKDWSTCTWSFQYILFALIW